MDTTGFKHIKLIVKKAMAFSDADAIDETKYFEMAISCYRDLRLHHVREGREIRKLAVDSTLKTIDFPDDMQDYIGIAIVDNGETVYLTERKAINPTTSTSGSEYYDDDIGEGEDVSDPFTLYWGNFATKGGYSKDGYYYVDWENRRFVLRNTEITQAWVHIITSGVSLSAETYIPVKYEDVMMAYIIWKVNRFRSSVPRSEREYLKNEYEEEVIKLRNSEIPTMTELNDLLDSLTHQGIRR